MTQRKLAERIVEQAERATWCVCCLCSRFVEHEECQYFDSPNYDDRGYCVEGIRQWLIEQNKKKEVEE